MQPPPCLGHAWGPLGVHLRCLQLDLDVPAHHPLFFFPALAVNLQIYVYISRAPVFLHHPEISDIMFQTYVPQILQGLQLN
eukprot:1145298-Pelagomonas_calceolata.AAC.5